jgi:pyridoxamine 5'-phosphate oxidase
MLKDLRKQYDRFTLNESNILENPFQQFKLWLSEAIKNEEYELNAMMLSTVDAELQPHSRMVLLKELMTKDLFSLQTMKETKEYKFFIIIKFLCCFSGRFWNVKCG